MTIFDTALEFEWDETKAESNYAKYGITFAEASLVFFDLDHFIEQDARREYGEMRFKIIGKTKEQIIAAVVYTDRENRIRLISARKARKNEKEKYHDQS